MIIVKLQGGLGNQMFQYAFGRTLAIINNTKISFDISFFLKNENSITPRYYALSNINIKSDIISHEKIANLLDRNSKWKKIINKSYIVIVEDGFSFKQDYIKLNKNVYISGYWQSEKYFQSIRHLLLTELCPIEKPKTQNKAFIEESLNKNFVAIHIRRGDYVTNPTANIFHGLCTKDYYFKSWEFLKSKVEKLTPVIFSDDIKWCKNKLDFFEQPIYVDWNSNCPEEDMRIMSKCKHFIIANSSFSWWGAWLAQNPNKIVIAPKKWFADASIEHNIIPEKWLKM